MADNLEERISERLKKLQSRKGYYYLLTHLNYPSDQKLLDEKAINAQIKVIEVALPEIKKLIKGIKKYIPHIWDQTKYAAAYLLLGKAFSNLETIILLAKKGHNLEMVDLARSGTESIDLAFLLFENSQNQQLEKWFKGRIIKNEKARKAFDRVINQLNPASVKLPVEEMKKEVYRTYSLYTHSSYAALLDSIDVLHEDFDFERYAGFHFARRNLHAVQDLAIKILLQLKNIYVQCKDKDNLNEVDKLLKQIGYIDMTPKEIAEIVNEHFGDKSEKDKT
jgi:hypothetical protein